VTIVVGDRFAGAPVLVKPEAMKVWAEVLQDPNPIHLDPAVVRAKGLGDRVINQGPANTAYVIDALLAQFPGARLRRLSVRFLGNLFGGETANASGVVTLVQAAPGGVQVHCDVALNVGARVVLSGSAVLDVSQSNKRLASDGADANVAN
jgi:acyl dehydratase